MLDDKVLKRFQWIGEGEASKGRKNFVYYSSFALDGMIFKLEDFVLIRNDDSVDPEDVSNCFIAKIKDLYDNGSKSIRYHAKVQWFSRVPDLPVHCRNVLNKVYDYEVIEDSRLGWSNIVDAETIFNKCLVIYLPVQIDKEPLGSTYKDGYPVFFCRYKLYKNKLEPIKKSPCEALSTCTTPNRRNKTDLETNRKSPRRRTSSVPGRTEKQYCAITTGSSLFPKVLLRRIDNRILESQNENIRILVAKPDAKSVEDVAENLDALTLWSPQTRKRPYIHTLTTTITPNKRSNVNKLSMRTADTSSSDSDSQPDTKTSSIRKVVKASKKSEKDQTPRRTSIRLQNCTPQKPQSVKKDIPSPSKISKIPRKVDFCSSTESPSIVKKNIPSPSKISKTSRTPRRLDFSPNTESPSIRRSGRKVKPALYTACDSSEDESKKKVLSSGKKRISKFIRASFSESGSESGFSPTDSSSSEDEELACDSSSLHKSTHTSRKRQKPSKDRKKLTLKLKALSIPDRKTPLKGPQNVLEESRLRLHVSAVPKSLPCREEEYSDIYSFVKGCLCSQTGGCMYISGVPGTGKTATVHEVIRNLEQEKEEGEIPLFSFVEVNGMWMTDPYQAYVHIFKCLTGKTIAPQQAANLLEKRFTEPGPKKDAVILLVDELDRLWTRKQTVMYNIFDWPSKKHSKLIVLAIANTMDLPERLMMNRISSRLGLTRKTFQPYNFKQLQEIIMSRIQELNVFDSDAVQLVSRKVAAVSGDARRALDICRHATEVAELFKSSQKIKTKVLIGMEHVDTAIQQMFSSPIISAIRAASKMEKLFFQCMLAEFKRIGSEETTLLKVSENIISSCRFEGLQIPSTSGIASICSRLSHSHLILVDNFRNGPYMKLRLNASPDDVNYALTGRVV